ncbi:MAG: hypothetical protein ACPGU1_15370 [Myxococcota bacterium]
MRDWTKLTLLTSAMLAFSLPALADDHSDMTPCESDADCGEYHVCVEGDAHDDEEVVLVTTEADEAVIESCDTDDDCGEGDWTCVDGVCMSEGVDEPTEPVEPVEPDEPEEAEKYCVVDLSALPVDPACESFCSILSTCGGFDDTGSSGSSMGSDGDGSEGGDASSSGFAPEEGEGSEDEGGDAEMPSADVPIQSCETTSDCAQEDAECIDGQCITGLDHSELPPPSSEPIEMSPEAMEQAIMLCNQVCSYGVYMEAALEEFATLNACLEAADSETICEDEPCTEESDAWMDAMESSGAMVGLETSVGASGGAAESGVSSDSALSSDDNASGSAEGTAGEDGAAEGGEDKAGDEGGCNASDAPLMPWVIVLGLLTVVFTRRREAL